ncbi:hypothetical protein [Bacillus sp. REN10]|uniref:hypothetical protein n=1 Tax=Bacillus sp. REN10 TaxID=2782541 RepID=UPI00193C7132|nr:hypothetical protein [Bacillus sp. REN10]
MKKYLLFTSMFILVYGTLQMVSGLVLTKLYTTDLVWKNVSSLPSEVELGSASSISPLMISLLTLGITFGVMKLFKQKIVE